MPTQESRYTELLESLGFILDDPDEIGRRILAKLPAVPDPPVYLRVAYAEHPQEVLTLVIDETNNLWGKVETRNKGIDLASHGFRDYFEYCGIKRTDLLN